MASSGFRPLAVLMLACILIAAPHLASGITCGQVVSYLSPCISYARNGGPIPAGCCNGVRGLKAAASTTLARQQTCGCLKSLLGSSGVKPGLVTGIPGKCGVSIGYPISTSVDCSKVR